MTEAGSKDVLERIFPRAFDNAYRGHWLGIALLALVALGKAIQGVESVVNTRDVVVRADAIALDRFGQDGAETVVALFALLGFYQLVLPLLSLAVLIRYRAMIPFLCLMLLFTQLGSRVLLAFEPIARNGTPVGLYVNLALLSMTAMGFLLSLVGGKGTAT